jgi:hypothetical protein
MARIADDYPFIAQRMKYFAGERDTQHGVGLFQHPAVVASRYWHITDGLRTVADFRTPHTIFEYKDYIYGLTREAIERLAQTAYTFQPDNCFGREDNMKIVLARLYLLLEKVQFDALTD